VLINARCVFINLCDEQVYMHALSVGQHDDNLNKYEVDSKLS